MYIYNLIYPIDAIISLDQLEYVVVDKNSPLSVTITTSVVTSQDIIVEVNVTDGTATGTCVCI